jgi:hypothetical protein
MNVPIVEATISNQLDAMTLRASNAGLNSRENLIQKKMNIRNSKILGAIQRLGQKPLVTLGTFLVALAIKRTA